MVDDPPLDIYDDAALPGESSQAHNTKTQGTTTQNSTSQRPAQTPSRDARVANTALADSPLFSELQSLFPGRIVKIEPHDTEELEVEDLTEVVDEDAILNPDLDELADDALGNEAA